MRNAETSVSFKDVKKSYGNYLKEEVMPMPIENKINLSSTQCFLMQRIYGQEKKILNWSCTQINEQGSFFLIGQGTDDKRKDINMRNERRMVVGSLKR